MPIIDVIKYDGSPVVLAWKHPNSELGTWTQLIVNESQEAILFRGGQALDVFHSGRHVLDTKNIPLIRNLINIPFGGHSPFTAEVWYVNKVHTLDIKWGTPTPIQIQDSKYGILIPVRAYGQFGIKITESKKFLVKLVGTQSLFDTETIINKFKGLFVSQVKDILSSYLISKKIGVLEINAYINDLSTYIKERIEPELDEYGISLVNFYIKGISIPDDDPSVIELKEALSKRAKMNIIGFDYTQERSFDTLEGAVSNIGNNSGNSGGSVMSDLLGATVGVGMGAAIGSNVATQFGGIAKELNTQPQMNNTPLQTIKCQKCQSTVDAGKRFCSDCGEEVLLPGEVTCENCNAKNEKGKNFCGDCGSSLIKECPKCNAIAEMNKKFCADCGEKLE